jgi:hypothetical protein
MYNYFQRRMLALFAALIAAITVIASQPAATFATEDNDRQISMEYRYAEGETPVIPDVISQFGVDYRLIGTSDPVAEGTLPETRTYTYRVSGLLTAEQIAQVSGLGDLKLTPVTGSRTYQVERDEVLTGLPTNDIEDLPPYQRYEESSAISPGATVSGELKLAEASFTVSGKDRYGLPDRYTAYTVYRGSETTTYTAYYSGEATYKRTVTEDGEASFVVVATYASADPVEIEEPVPLEQPAPVEEPGGSAEDLVLAGIDENPNPLAAFWDSRSASEKIVLLAGIAVVIAVILIILLFVRRRKQHPRPPGKNVPLYT